MLQITGYSIITSIYSSDMMRYIGYIEICVGVGLGMGPVVGSLFYSFLDYEGTMYLFGLCDAIATFLCICLIPSILNQGVSEEKMVEIEDQHDELMEKISMITGKKRIRITWCTLLTCKEAMFSLLSCFVGTFNIMFWQSWLSSDMQ